jgi:flagellar biosynthesis regulator FlbT
MFKKNPFRLPPKILKVIKILEFKEQKNTISLKGSNSFSILRFPVDFDLMQLVEITNPIEILNDIKKKVKDVLNINDVYFKEIKIQTKEPEVKKIRFYKADDFLNYDDLKFKEIYEDIDFIKIDIIIYENYLFYDVSCIYFTKIIKKNDIIKMLKKDIKELIEEKKYFKVFKRLFNLYLIEDKYNRMNEVVKILNSPIGEKYQKAGFLEVIESLKDTDNKKIKKKIEQSLKVLNVPNNRSIIHNTINELYKEVNDEAKKIYNEL